MTGGTESGTHSACSCGNMCGKRAHLVRPESSWTKEGEHQSATDGRGLPASIDVRQKLITEGAFQFIAVRGKKTRIRTGATQITNGTIA